VQEQQELRDQTIAAFHQAVQESDDDLLVPREKTKDELDREEEEYQEFLRREVGEDLNRLIEVDKDQLGIFEEPPQDYVPGKKKVKGKGKEKGTNVDDQEFLMK
jgi:protein KRI1